MSFINIDEIIKKGLQESEIQHEFLVNKSKNRVWKAIEKPHKQNSLHWGFVTAIAASVLLFLISVFLFYKLDLKQKELNVLLTTTGKPPIESSTENPYTGENTADTLDIKSDVFPGPMEAEGKEQISSLDHDPNLAEKADAEADNRQLIPLPLIKSTMMDFNPVLTIPEIDPLELKEGLCLSGPFDYKIPSATKQKKHEKLKIRIGNGSPSHRYHNSLALTLTL